MYSSQDSKRGKNMTTATAAAVWSRADDKLFEGALVKFPDGVANRWEMIAGCLAGKTADDVMVHYETLLYDVAQIEAGLVELPSYSELTQTGRSSGIQPPPTAAAKRSQSQRKKGKPWTVQEHMLFLLGLEKYGKSDWRSISRNVVVTRQPSQVASHAQKFFNRQKSEKKDRKRSSIHDITKPSDCITQTMDCLTHVNVNDMDRLTGIDNANAAAMNCYTTTTNNNSNMDYYTDNDTTSVGVNYDTTSVGVNYDTTSVGEDCYTDNDTTSYINYDTTSVGVDRYVNNDTTSVGGDCYIDNDTTGAVIDFFDGSEYALDCLSLPESYNTLDYLSVLESYNTTNTNATSVSAPANANANFQMPEWPSDPTYPGMDSRF